MGGILHIVPKSCTDAIYSKVQQDECSDFLQLSNLIPAIDTPDQWVPRPAAIQLATSVYVASAICVVGNYVYGMRASNTYPGFDEPFAYNILAGTYTTVSGVASSAVLPASLSAGAWQPPHCEPIGAYILVSHTGFTGIGTQFFGAINISNPAAPAWTIQNTTTNALPSVPVWITQFNNRAYFFLNPAGVTPALYCSDNPAGGGPLSRSAAVAGVILTFGDNTPLLCGGVNALTNITTGGVVQAMYIFKNASIGNANMYQLTGDSGSSTLSLQAMNAATGTVGPNTVVSTPLGLFFIAPDGLRTIDFNGRVSNPLGYEGKGINTPFIYSTIPSRMASACNASVLRITTQNGNLSGAPQQDWCFDINTQKWYGPHTFPIALMATWGNTFILSPTLASGNTGLYTSNLFPSSTDSFTEAGSPLAINFQSALLPDRPQISELSSVKSVLYTGYGAGTTTYNISIVDQQGIIIAFTSVSFTISQVNWDEFSWGDGTVINAAAVLGPIDIPWTQPFAFDRISLQVQATGVSTGFRLGAFHLKYEESNFTVRTSGQ